jgi:hypothetical protein
MMLARARLEHYGRQNRTFEATTIEREKTADWMAGRAEFELSGPFVLSKRTLLLGHQRNMA